MALIHTFKSWSLKTYDRRKFLQFFIAGGVAFGQSACAGRSSPVSKQAIVPTDEPTPTPKAAEVTKVVAPSATPTELLPTLTPTPSETITYKPLGEVFKGEISPLIDSMYEVAQSTDPDVPNAVVTKISEDENTRLKVLEFNPSRNHYWPNCKTIFPGMVLSVEETNRFRPIFESIDYRTSVGEWVTWLKKNEVPLTIYGSPIWANGENGDPLAVEILNLPYTKFIYEAREPFSPSPWAFLGFDGDTIITCIKIDNGQTDPYAYQAFSFNKHLMELMSVNLQGEPVGFPTFDELMERLVSGKPISKLAVIYPSYYHRRDSHNNILNYINTGTVGNILNDPSDPRCAVINEHRKYTYEESVRSYQDIWIDNELIEIQLGALITGGRATWKEIPALEDIERQYTMLSRWPAAVVPTLIE